MKDCLHLQMVKASTMLQKGVEVLKDTKGQPPPFQASNRHLRANKLN